MNWNKIADWFRGYSPADIESVRRKMDGPHKPGSVVYVTDREFCAWRHLLRTA